MRSKLLLIIILALAIAISGDAALHKNSCPVLFLSGMSITMF